MSPRLPSPSRPSCFHAPAQRMTLKKLLAVLVPNFKPLYADAGPQTSTPSHRQHFRSLSSACVRACLRACVCVCMPVRESIFFPLSPSLSFFVASVSPVYFCPSVKKKPLCLPPSLPPPRRETTTASVGNCGSTALLRTRPGLSTRQTAMCL